jgi:AcrR family transcriptional regulator
MDRTPTEDRRRQILRAALRAFSEKGFAGATNRDIARGASIRSPGLIYHYFADKQDLFEQVVRAHVPAVGLLDHTDDLMALPPREALMRAGLAIASLGATDESMAFLRMMMGESARSPEVAALWGRIGPDRGIAFLTAYLRRQADLGVLRPIEPPIAARCFVGPLIAYIIGRALFRQPDALAIEPEAMVAQTVETFLGGAEIRPRAADT